MDSRIQHQDFVPDELAFQRLDHVASLIFPEYSRSRIQAWIRSGELLVDGETRRPRDKLSGGELLVIDAARDETDALPEAIPLDIRYEDDDILIVDKPAGLVVHPGAGNRQGTMLNALLHRCPELTAVPRAGIVHRLDKNTTGLMVVARTLASQTRLVEQLQNREVRRIYRAVVYGVPDRDGTVDAPVGRHPVHRTRMAVRSTGKEAVTRYRVIKRFRRHALLEFSLETGRTHQIRVHMQHLGYPLVGDSLYGGQYRRPKYSSERLAAGLKAFQRQALHACELAFVHPLTGRNVDFHSGLPADIRRLLELLEDEDAGT